MSEIDSNVDSDVISVETVEDNQKDLSINESKEIEVLNSAEDSEILSTNYTPKNSNEIQTYVDSASDGDTIILDGNYVFTNTVNVAKQLNFIGINDATVDGNNNVGLFSVSNAAVTFKDITFKNGKTTNVGGAIYFYYGGSVVNCSFVNNSADDGGAVYFGSSGEYGSAMNCSFVNNSADYGGALYFIGVSGSLVGCSFVGNSASSAGAVYVKRGSCYIVNCSLVNNSASSYGGAVYLDDGSCVNCSFVGNSVKDDGGAVYLDDGSVVGCSFVGNSASSDGGAICYNGGPGTVVNCSFVNNSAGSFGGAIERCNAFDCRFIGNSAGGSGGAVSRGSAVNCSFVNNSASSNGAMAGGSAVNCSFVGNHAHGWNQYGGAFGSYDGPVVNCSFVNNSAVYYGGAVYLDDGSVVNCSFIGNSARCGGAIYGGVDAVNCSFVGSYASVSGGAMSQGSAVNCSFVNNSAGSKGGAMMGGHSALSCIFVNNSASDSGGAIYSNNMNIYLCKFINCSSNGNYLDIRNENGYAISDCIFDVPPEGLKMIYNTILNIDDLFIIQGDNGYLQANLSDVRGPLYNKVVTFMINGVKENRTTFSNGLASLNVNDIFTGLGEYDVNVSFAGDEVNTAVSKNIKVSIIAYQGILNVTQDGKYYDDCILVINLINSRTAEPIAKANIELKFSNGKNITVSTDNNGKYSYKVPFAPGEYNFTARVCNDFVDVNDVEMNMNIFRLEGEIQLSLSNSNRTVNIKLVNSDTDDVYRNVRVDLEFSNGEKDSVRTNNLGIASYNIQFEKGTYSVKAIVLGENKYFTPSEINGFIINKESDPNMGNIIYNKISFGNSIVFDYLKSGSTTWAVVGGTILRENISVDGHSEADIKLVGNVITVSGLDVGSYTLRVASTPEDNFYSDEATVGITVNKVSVMISAPKASVYYNSGKTWSIKMYDGKTKEVLSNMKVTVKVYTGSKLYKSFTLTTDAKGIASLKVSTWIVGAHKVVVSFSKDGYTSKTVDSVVTILKTPVVITAPKLSVYLKTAKKWSIKVIDSKTKKAIASTKLTLKVYTGKKYKSYFVKTNSKGIATFATSGLAVGTHKIVVSFSKTGYVSKSVSSSIVVKPIPLTIKGDFSYGGSGSTVRVTVTNKLTGKPANGISVKLMVYTGSKLTKSYTLVTGNYKAYKGFVGFGTNAFSVGTHKVVIKPVSNMYSGQGTTSLVIKSGAANGGVYYSFVSKGKLTLS